MRGTLPEYAGKKTAAGKQRFSTESVLHDRGLGMASRVKTGLWDSTQLQKNAQLQMEEEGDSTMMLRGMVEKFPIAELQDLRNGLLQSGLDTWQAAELISSFLSGRGYGVSRQRARDAVTRLEGISCSLEHMQEELEKLALVM